MPLTRALAAPAALVHALILYDGNKVPGIDELNLADLIPLSQTCKLSSRRYAEHLLLPLRFTNDLLLLPLRCADDLLPLQAL